MLVYLAPDHSSSLHRGQKMEIVNDHHQLRECSGLPLEMAGADRWFRVETGGVELVPLEEIVTAYQLQYSVEKRNHL